MDKEFTLDEFIECAPILRTDKFKRFSSVFHNASDEILRSALAIIYNNPQKGFDIGSKAMMMLKENDDITDAEIGNKIGVHATTVGTNLRDMCRDLYCIIDTLEMDGDKDPISLRYFCYTKLPKSVYNPILRNVRNKSTITLNEFLDTYTYDNIMNFRSIGKVKMCKFIDAIVKYGRTIKLR